MIISEKHRYLFLETPHTGSTAISKELRSLYDGRPILEKHSSYAEIKKLVGPEIDSYYVFAGVRNPLDEVVSIFYKFLTNHKGNYDNLSLFSENGGWVGIHTRKKFAFVQRTKSFSQFIDKYHRLPFTSAISINGPHCDRVLRFEQLASDFTLALNDIGLSQKRPLPQTNQTGLSHEQRRRAIGELSAQQFAGFIPFMEEWKYDTSPHPQLVTRPRMASYALYKALKIARLLYHLHLAASAGPLRSRLRSRIS